MSRQDKLRNLESWADKVKTEDLAVADTVSLQRISKLVQQREDIGTQIDQAVAKARLDGATWADIGTMLGVSKQAAQHKYGNSNFAA